MPFNEEQAEAIAISSQKDVLISAGAGSGKTKTLSERVYGLVTSGEVEPEGLLVLTFTDNAAHEMKSRILSRFGLDHPLYGRMLSCHVQSFDSFYAYLVRKYADALGISPSFSILSESLANQKDAEAVDQALRQAYEDPIRRRKIIDFLSRYGQKDDAGLKDAVLQLGKALGRFTPKKREKYVERYAERFLCPEFARDLYRRVVEENRQGVAEVLRKTYVADRLWPYYASSEEEIDEAKRCDALFDASLYSSPISHLFLRPDSTKEAGADRLNQCFETLKALIEHEGEDYVCFAQEIHEEIMAMLPAQYPGLKKKERTDADTHVPAFQRIKEVKPLLSLAASLGTAEEEYERLDSFRDATEILFSLWKGAEATVREYRLSHNAFSFDDISAFVLSLFTSPEHEAIAKAIRNRFTYIMVDEYQDTNDAQEIFLEGLLRVKEDGTRAHLFCVGDAKQSIYAFRGSNVGLFRDRQRRYLGEAGAKVIAMNKNYRSAKRLLADINHIFTYYMTLDLGGIDYRDPLERLTYDDEVNLYKESLSGYGIHRILPPQGLKLVPSFRFGARFHDAEYEAKAILSDIEKKLAEGFLVFDRGLKKSRPCKKSDFAILVRRKKSVRVYEKLFREAGIPLNNKVKANLREGTAILMLQSLLRLLALRMGILEGDLAHAFLSVARSYLYHYPDQRLHDILSLPDEERTKAIESDPIIIAIDHFKEDYASAPFRVAFLALLDRFQVIEKLYLMGEVEEHIDKIESLYRLCCMAEEMGSGLKEFVLLLLDMDQRSLDIDAETVVSNVDAVDFMTIHASKGLERKIVYLPSSDNGVSSVTEKGGLFRFQEDLGLIFPYVEFPTYAEPETSFLTLPLRCKDNPKDQETEEHVRLLYVALTRAENALYLVGRDRGKNSAYVMCLSLPKHYAFHPDLLEKGIINAEAVQALDALAQKSWTPWGEEHFLTKADHQAFLSLLEEAKKGVEEAKQRLLYECLDAALSHYGARFALIPRDEDLDARLFAAMYYPSAWKDVHGFDDLARLIGAKDPFEEEEEAMQAKASASLKKRLEDFHQAVVELDYALLFPLIPIPEKRKNDEAYPRQCLIDALLLPLAQCLDGLPYLAYESYATEDYADETEVYDDADYKASEKEEVVAPDIDEDDTALEFPVLQGKRASKRTADEDLPSPEVLQRGERLHRYMELLDWETLDLSFIPDAKERGIIEKALGTPLMQQARHAQSRYGEYGYYDEENLTTGSMDLLFVCQGVYHVVDYKSGSIDDPAYVDQLHAYGRAVMRLFHVKKEQVKLHLLSLSRGVSLDVDFSD